jgi:chromosome segregation ATPase
MARVKDEPQRGRLAQLQDLLTGGSQVLLDQANSLRDGLQTRLVEVGRTVEEQVASLMAATEERLGERLDELLNRLSVSIRKDIDKLRERLRVLETRIADVPKEGVSELVAPLRNLANNAIESAAAAQVRIEELTARLQHVERRAAEITRETTHDTAEGEESRNRVERMDQRLTDLGREVGTKLGELGALRERLTRIEARVLETSKDQIARAGEATGLRDRLARLEARLSDLSREQVARAVEAAGLRERVFRLEQRASTLDPSRPLDDAPSPQHSQG